MKDYSKILWITAVALVIAAFFVANVEINSQMSNISAIFIIILAIPCYAAMIYWLGWKKGLIAIIVFSVYALAIETFAIITGFPYSPFEYSGLIGAKVFGYTPFTVPFAYVPLFLGCIYLASKRTNKNILFIFITALLVLAADLVLDPAAVALNFWKYQWPGIFYDVPLMNFFGWILTGILASGIAVIVMGKPLQKPKPDAIVGSLFLILAFWGAVCLYMGLIIPGIIGIAFIIYILWETKGRVGQFNYNQNNE